MTMDHHPFSIKIRKNARREYQVSPGLLSHICSLVGNLNSVTNSFAVGKGNAPGSPVAPELKFSDITHSIFQAMNLNAGHSDTIRTEKGTGFNSAQMVPNSIENSRF